MGIGLKSGRDGSGKQWWDKGRTNQTGQFKGAASRFLFRRRTSGTKIDKVCGGGVGATLALSIRSGRQPTVATEMPREGIRIRIFGKRGAARGVRSGAGLGRARRLQVHLAACEVLDYSGSMGRRSRSDILFHRSCARAQVGGAYFTVFWPWTDTSYRVFHQCPSIFQLEIYRYFFKWKSKPIK